MRKKLLIAFISLFIGFFILPPTSDFNSVRAMDKPQAINGILDLTEWNWDENDIIDLNGQWEFYWQELLTPKDFENTELIKKRELISLPRAWNHYVFKDKELTGKGYATYRLLIKHKSEQILGIKIPRVFTSYKLWINDELIASAGNVSTDNTLMTPQYIPQVKYFYSDSENIKLVIQVANFRHRSGGILENIKIGGAAQINELRNRNIALELFLFGSLFITGFYHLALFLFRKKDKSTLYFGIFSLLVSARTLLVGEVFFIHLFPLFNWEIAHKIQTLSYYVGVYLVYAFIKTFFPQEVSKKATVIIQIITSFFTLLVLFTPANIFTHFNPIFQVFSLIVILYLIYIVLCACYRKREGSKYITIGVIILILFSINDIIFLSIVFADSDYIYLRNFVTRGNLSSFGLLFFIFTQSLVLAKRFSKSFTKVELLTKQLQNANTTLEEKVKERTSALEASKEKLKEAYQAVSRSEKSLQNLMQNISHDLRTPLSAIKGFVNAILDGVINDPLKQKIYLKRVVDKVNYLNYMVQELMDLSLLQSREMRFDFTLIPANELIDTFTEKYRYDMSNENIVFHIQFASDSQYDNLPATSFLIKADLQKLERVFANLLNNALKYTVVGGEIELKFTVDKRKLLIEITDNGIGISEVELPHIFERFYMISKSRESQTPESSGLGLAITKEIVEYHGGEIWVESKLGEGSHFFFTLPIKLQA